MSWLQTAVEKIRAFAYKKPPHRLPGRPKLGLALSGGFARGIAHIGVLKVLEESGIHIDCIAGTSVGALTATMYAAGTPLEVIMRQAAATSFRDFGRWTLSWLGLATNTRLEDYLRKASPVTNFDQLRIPLAIVATDLGTGEPVYFTSGEIAPPLRASCAYPGLFLPVEHEGRLLVDGFLSAPVPVEAVRQLGADTVIAVYLESSPPDEKPDSVMDVIGRSFSIMQRHHRAWRRDADVVIEPDVAHFAWNDFERAPQLIAAGEAAARAALPRIRGLLSPRPIERGESLSESAAD
jgi:NTE family protein